MKNALVILTAFCAGSALIGCNSGNNNSSSQPAPAKPAAKPANEPVDQTSSSWTLKYETKCDEAIDLTQCTGAHGFTVQQNGEYQVGPDANGTVRVGALTESEKAELHAAMGSSLTAQNRIQAEAHESVEEASDREESLSFVRGSQSATNLIRSSGTDLFFQTQSSNEAKSLLTAVRNLAQAHASNFPDECQDGKSNLISLMDKSKSCSNDSDCVYLANGSLEIVNASSSETLMTDDCSEIYPLVVGNAESVRISKDSILKKLDSVQNACGEKLIREGCTEFGTYELKGAAPVCRQNVCQIPS